jgi:1-acyl-sn-glycerol-3-phosphate acyltransferase
MAALCRFLFFFMVVKPLALVVLGLNVRRGNLLPRAGPAILVANHNSHLDTIVLLSLFPYRVATKVRPVAAADYFLRKNRILAWFALHVVRIIPVDRTLRAATVEMLHGVSVALAAGEIVLLYPEGTRGEPEHLGQFRSGIAHIAKPHPEVPVIPVFVHGAGKALPRGESILVPFFCDIFVGTPLFWCGDRSEFMERLEHRFHELAAEGEFPQWT